MRAWQYRSPREAKRRRAPLADSLGPGDVEVATIRLEGHWGAYLLDADMLDAVGDADEHGLVDRDSLGNDDSQPQGEPFDPGPGRELSDAERADLLAEIRRLKVD